MVDTSVLLATADASTPEHVECADLLDNFDGRLIVPATVVAEAAWMIQTRLGDLAERLFMESIIDGSIDVWDLTVGDYQRCVDICVAYPQLGLGLTDASLVVLTEHLDVDQFATLNGRDFYVVRPRHVTALTLLPDGVQRPTGKAWNTPQR